MPPELSHLEDERLETLVCYDSRADGKDVWDLSDKELSKLIAEVAVNSPHILVIIDSCHSGFSSRDAVQDISVRMAPVNGEPRPLDKFLFTPEEIKFLF